jgi:sensor domain CHASE-containing protein
MIRIDGPTSRRRRIVIAVALLFFAVASIFAAIVLRSIDTIKDNANRIDDERAVEAARGAVDSLRTQLSGTIHDNATWDGAYKQLNSITRQYWIIDNWATTASDNPLYDTAVVIDVRGKIIVAYKDGKEMTEKPSRFFGTEFGSLVAEAYARPRQSKTVPVHFIRSSDGIALIGAATIRPSSDSFRVEDNNLYALVFARHLSPDLVKNLSRAFRIDGLALSNEMKAEMLNVPLKDLSSETIAYLNWPSKSPGSKSFMEVRTQLAVGCVILIVFLAGIGFVGVTVIRKLREDEAFSRLKALRDSLTGLWNRAALLEHLAACTSYPTGALVHLHLIDLDGFKGVNDTWGHATGDRLIVAVALKLLAELPSGTFIARLGGDEFATVSVDDMDGERPGQHRCRYNEPFQVCSISTAGRYR